MNTQMEPSASPVPMPVKPRTPWKVWVAFALCMVVMVAGTFAVYWYTTLQTYHLAVVQPGVLYRDGNRGLREFKHAVAITQVKTVVSLIDDMEMANPAKPQFQQESEYLNGKGVQYIRLPVKLGGWPKEEDIRQFNEICINPANQPVLIHCAQGVRRTGMFVAAYQESILHQTPAQAESEILTFKHKPADLDDVRAFIKSYDPAKQKLPTTMHGSAGE